MNVRIKLLAALLAAAAAAGPAYAMDVATYLAKAQGLQAMGMRAMFSSDYTELQTETRASIAYLRTERLAAQRAGRRQAYCPPERISLGPAEILGAMSAVPPARRARTQVRDALRADFARRYPCPR
jgi:hypothetical protein